MVCKDFPKEIIPYLQVIIWSVLGIMVLSTIGCGDQKSDSEATKPNDQSTEAQSDPGSGRAGETGDLGAGYLLQEDFSQNKYRITYFSESHNTMTMIADGTTRPVKEQRVEAVMILSPIGTDPEGQRKLLLETNQIVLDTNSVKIDSRKPPGPDEYVRNRRLYDLRRGLKMLAEMRLTLIIDEENKILNISGSDLLNNISSSESDTFKTFMNSFGQTFKLKIAQSVIMAAADYLPLIKIEVGSNWNILILDEVGGLGQLNLQVRGRLDEIITVDGREQGRISFVIRQDSSDERTTKMNGQTVKITRMSHNGAGRIVFNLAEHFVEEYSIRLFGNTEVVLPDDVKGKFSTDEKVRLTKEIINGDQELLEVRS